MNVVAMKSGPKGSVTVTFDDSSDESVVRRVNSLLARLDVGEYDDDPFGVAEALVERPWRPNTDESD